MKLKPADIVFSQCVRGAANHICLRCGIQKPPTNKRGSSGMDCSHVNGRRHRTIRWCKDNAKCLCSGCHRWWHENPTQSGIWYENIVGQSFLDILTEKMNSKVKVSKLEERDIAKHYREQLKMIEAQRELQPTGYIDFESWQ